MWTYEKRLQYPVHISQPNPKIAMVILTQFGGPDGELAASQRYLAQRYSMPYRNVAGILTDIGTEAAVSRQNGAYRNTVLLPHLFSVIVITCFIKECKFYI